MCVCVCVVLRLWVLRGKAAGGAEKAYPKVAVVCGIDAYENEDQ